MLEYIDYGVGDGGVTSEASLAPPTFNLGRTATKVGTDLLANPWINTAVANAIRYSPYMAYTAAVAAPVALAARAIKRNKRGQSAGRSIVEQGITIKSKAQLKDLAKQNKASKGSLAKSYAKAMVDKKDKNGTMSAIERKELYRKIRQQLRNSY